MDVNHISSTMVPDNQDINSVGVKCHRHGMPTVPKITGTYTILDPQRFYKHQRAKVMSTESYSD